MMRSGRDAAQQIQRAGRATVRYVGNDLLMPQNHLRGVNDNVVSGPHNTDLTLASSHVRS